MAVFNASHPTERYVLFVRPGDREREIWDGYRAGVEGAVDTYGADAACPVADLAKKLREYAVGRTRVFYSLGNPHLDDTIEHWGCTLVAADAFTVNVASQRLLEKVGFRIVAVHPDYHAKRGEPVDGYRYPANSSPLRWSEARQLLGRVS